MVLLDSNILIYAAQPEHAFLDVLITDAESCISAISIPEVFGYSELLAEDEANFNAWFAHLRVLEVTEPILREAAGLRRHARMKLGDSIIAATALLHDAKLATRNVDDFRHVQKLKLINPFDRT